MKLLILVLILNISPIFASMRSLFLEPNTKNSFLYKVDVKNKSNKYIVTINFDPTTASVQYQFWKVSVVPPKGGGYDPPIKKLEGNNKSVQITVDPKTKSDDEVWIRFGAGHKESVYRLNLNQFIKHNHK